MLDRWIDGYFGDASLRMTKCKNNYFLIIFIEKVLLTDFNQLSFQKLNSVVTLCSNSANVCRLIYFRFHSTFNQALINQLQIGLEKLFSQTQVRDWKKSKSNEIQI
jgi:hypothetical protein